MVGWCSVIFLVGYGKLCWGALCLLCVVPSLLGLNEVSQGLALPGGFGLRLGCLWYDSGFLGRVFFGDCFGFSVDSLWLGICSAMEFLVFVGVYLFGSP